MFVVVLFNVLRRTKWTDGSCHLQFSGIIVKSFVGSIFLLGIKNCKSAEEKVMETGSKYPVNESLGVTVRGAHPTLPLVLGPRSYSHTSIPLQRIDHFL